MINSAGLSVSHPPSSLRGAILKLHYTLEVITHLTPSPYRLQGLLCHTNIISSQANNKFSMGTNSGEHNKLSPETHPTNLDGKSIGRVSIDEAIKSFRRVSMILFLRVLRGH